MSTSLSPRTQYVLAVLGVVAVALAGYLLLVGPKRSEAAKLDRELSELRAAQIVQPSQSRESGDVVELFLLAKAMPDTMDMPGVVLDLSRLASTSGLDLMSITPQPVVAGQGFEALPLQAIVEGRYPAISRFLRRLRTRVALRDGRVVLHGRLYTVAKLEFATGTGTTAGLRLRATVTLNAYRFGAEAAPPGTAALPPAGAQAAPSP